MKKVTFRKLATEADSIKFLQSFHVVQQKYYTCVPKFEEQTKEANGTTYYQGTQKTYEFNEVKGIPFTIRINENLEMDCFLYKGKGAKTWIAWDALTGHSLAQLASTKEEAIKDASLKIELTVRSLGIHGMLNAIIDVLNTKGLSPRYEYNPDKPKVAAPDKKPAKKPVVKQTAGDRQSRLLDLLAELAIVGQHYIPRVVWGNQGLAARQGFTGRRAQDEYHGWELAQIIKNKDTFDAVFRDFQNAGNKYGFIVSSLPADKKGPFIVIQEYWDNEQSFMVKFPVDSLFTRRQELENSQKQKATQKPGPTHYQSSILRNAYYDALRTGDKKTAEALLQKMPDLLVGASFAEKKIKSIKKARKITEDSRTGRFGRFSDIQYRRGTGTKKSVQGLFPQVKQTDNLLPDSSYQYRYMTNLTPENADYFVIYDSPVIINAEAVAYAVVKRHKANDVLTVRYYSRSGKHVATDDFVKYTDRIAHTEVIYRGDNGNNTISYINRIIKGLWGVKRRRNKARITTTVSKWNAANSVTRPSAITVSWSARGNIDRGLKTKMSLEGIAIPERIPNGPEFDRITNELAMQILNRYLSANNMRVYDIDVRVPGAYSIQNALIEQVLGTNAKNRPAPKFQKGDWVNYTLKNHWPEAVQIAEKARWSLRHNEYYYVAYIDGDEPLLLESVLTPAKGSTTKLKTKALPYINKLNSL
nr:hypothetical protein [uncultured Arsenicibacter sp.]